MQTYIALMTFTEKGSKDLKRTTARAAAFKKLAKEHGVEVKKTYWLSGQFDIMHIIDVKDNDAAMIHSLSLMALGNVRTQTFRAYDKGEITELLKHTFNAYDLLRASDE